MNETVIKRAIIFSLILGATIGLVALIPALSIWCIFTLSFLSSVIIMWYMRAKENYFTMLTSQEGATVGAIIGFSASLGFFVSFCPMVLIIHLIFKNYYTYGIPYIMQYFWLFLIIVAMVSLIFAATNCTTGMGISYIFNRIGQKPENYDAQLDIKIED